MTRPATSVLRRRGIKPVREEARDENCGRWMMSRGGLAMHRCRREDDVVQEDPRIVRVHGTSVVYSVWKKCHEARRHEVCSREIKAT